MFKVLITGANGFIGQALCERMLSRGWQVRGTVRSLKSLDSLPKGVDAQKINSIGPDTDWTKALIGIDAVVHLATRVHVMNDIVADPFAAFRRVNVNGTENLARKAAFANIKRFLYMSSIKVNGEGRWTPYKEEDIQNPQDPYGISKWEAEQALRRIGDETGMETVIIRPPLVYGPGVRANLLRLFKVVDRGIPLPLARVNNRRSLIYLGNLVDAIVTCITHPRATGQTYLVSDGEDVSTPELIRRIGSALGRPARLFPFSPLLINIAGCISGKSTTIDRLTGSLTVDSSRIQRELDWKSPFSMTQGLIKTAEWYLKEHRGLEK